MSANLLAFFAMAFILVVTPGTDFSVVVPNALRSRSAGIATAVAFSVVKYAGAIFLVVLGVRALLRSRSTYGSGERSQPAPCERPLGVTRAYRQGLTINVLNPKAPLIYLSIMPQFLETDSPQTVQLWMMSAILVGTALVWYVALSFLVTAVRPLVERFRLWIDRVSGAVLIVLGIRVAAEVRPA